MAINDITGDSIRTKKTSDAYRDNWEKIFKAQGLKVQRHDPNDDKITGAEVTTIIVDEMYEEDNHE